MNQNRQHKKTRAGGTSAHDASRDDGRDDSRLMDGLSDMALFVAVVKARSFSKAADALGRPQSTVSRRVAQLERGLGLRLLNRTTRRVEPTEAGRLYFERCWRIIEDARLAREEVTGMLTQPRGLIRASLPVDLAVEFLAPLLSEFSGRYPDIRFEFDLTPRRVDLVGEPFDVAIRIGEAPDSHLIARPLARLRAALFASPSYLQRRGKPETPDDLASHACFHRPQSPQRVWRLCRGEEQVVVPVAPHSFDSNNVGMSRRLAVLGHGIVLLPPLVLHQELARGELVPVLPGWQGEPVVVQALTETRLLPAKTLRFIEFLREKMEALPDSAA